MSAQPLERSSDLAVLARRAGDALEGASAHEIVQWAVDTFGDRVVVATSMQDAVLVDIASTVQPGIGVVFLDTGYHFPETLGMRDAVAAAHPVRLLSITPTQTVAEQDAQYGADLWARDPDLCCKLRKVQPLAEAMADYDAWMTGVRRVEAPTRRRAKPVEWDAGRGKVKINPIVAWTDDDVAGYVEEHGVLVNPLHAEGYPSIGCWPCTRRVAADADPRSGRWAGTGKFECGLHAD